MAVAYPQNLIWSEPDPFKGRDGIIPQKEVDDLRRQLIDLTDRGIIREYNTIVKPPPGTRINKMVKFCLDFYWHNTEKIPDFFSDQKIKQALNCLAGNRHFSVLGLVTDLGQVPMYPGERVQPYTIKPIGFYETERMQPGYCNMLAMFQRLMERVFRDMNMVYLLIFLDYIIVFGTTFEEHQMRLEKTFRRLHREDYKVSMARSSFCFPSFDYFGHLVSEDGIEIAPEKVEAMSSWPTPKTISELNNFLEFCGFYQHFYKDFAELSKPLKQLQLDVAEDRQKDNEAIPRVPWWTRESIEERWTRECSEAFHSLKIRIIHAPALDRVNMS